jgi:hypothetical protein
VYPVRDLCGKVCERDKVQSLDVLGAWEKGDGVMSQSKTNKLWVDFMKAGKEIGFHVVDIYCPKHIVKGVLFAFTGRDFKNFWRSRKADPNHKPTLKIPAHGRRDVS